MNTKPSIHDQVTAARQKITDLTTASQTETDQARAELAQLEAQAAKIDQAEQARAAERGRTWAAHYLETSTEREEQQTELRDAARALREALADEPWVKALTDWHRARRRSDLIRDREATARAYLGMTPVNAAPAPESAAHWNNGVPSPAFFLSPLLDVIDGTVNDEINEEREQRTAQLEALLHAPDGKGDPLANLPQPRPGQAIHDPHRTETTRLHAPDGTVILSHRNIDSDQVTYSYENGKPYKPQPVETDDDA